MPPPRWLRRATLGARAKDDGPRKRRRGREASRPNWVQSASRSPSRRNGSAATWTRGGAKPKRGWPNPLPRSAAQTGGTFPSARARKNSTSRGGYSVASWPSTRRPRRSARHETRTRAETATTETGTRSGSRRETSRRGRRSLVPPHRPRPAGEDGDQGEGPEAHEEEHRLEERGTVDDLHDVFACGNRDRREAGRDPYRRGGDTVHAEREVGEEGRLEDDLARTVSRTPAFQLPGAAETDDDLAPRRLQPRGRGRKRLPAPDGGRPRDRSRARRRARREAVDVESHAVEARRTSTAVPYRPRNVAKPEVPVARRLVDREAPCRPTGRRCGGTGRSAGATTARIPKTSSCAGSCRRGRSRTLRPSRARERGSSPGRNA